MRENHIDFFHRARMTIFVKFAIFKHIELQKDATKISGFSKKVSDLSTSKFCLHDRTNNLRSQWGISNMATFTNAYDHSGLMQKSM